MSTTACSLLLLIGAFRMDLRPDATFEIVETVPEVVQIEEVVQTEHIAKPPPPPRPPVPIEVPNDEVLEDDVLDIDAEIDFDEPVDVPPPPPPAPEEDPEPEIFVIVEQMPEMKGGLEQLYDDLRYPELAQKAGMEGMSVIQIIIDEQGMPSSPTVLRSAGDILDNAAIDALLKQRFEPGRQRGKPVMVRMSFPITFRLS
jgi:protein TonB